MYRTPSGNSVNRFSINFIEVNTLIEDQDLSPKLRGP